MELSITSWGNSLGLRIPKTIADLIGIGSGSKVKAELKNGKLIIFPASQKSSLKAIAKSINLKTLVAKVKPQNMHHVEEDFPAGKEVW